MRKENRQKGFTLFELIVVLFILGIIAAFAGLGIVSAVQGYMFLKDNAAVSEKAQLALERINRELLECYTCSGTTGTNVLVPFSNPLGQRTIQWSGVANDPIVILDGTDPDILLDNVALFTMRYNLDKSITVTIRSSTKPGGVTVQDFVTKVYPRNTL